MLILKFSGENFSVKILSALAEINLGEYFFFCFVKSTIAIFLYK